MYENFYGLSASPFQIKPDPGFFFWSHGHRRAYKNLKHGLSHGGGFVVITGEVGAGKTTLVRLLLTEIDPRKVIAVQLVSTQLDADNLLRAVALAFGLSQGAQGAAQLPGAIEAFLVSLGREGKRALLVIDEAQNLSPGALNELFKLANVAQGHGAFLLQCVLAGQPELRASLAQPSMQRLAQRIIASYHLGQLEEAETQPYVEHRLGHVGWKNDPAFEPPAFAALFTATLGIPRRINSLCDRLLLGAYLAQKHRIGPADVAATAAELRDELGASALPSAKPAARFGVGLAPGVSGSDTLRTFMLASVTARLDRLERNVANMLEKVRAFAGRANAKPLARRQPAPKPANPGAKGLH